MDAVPAGAARSPHAGQGEVVPAESPGFCGSGDVAERGPARQGDAVPTQAPAERRSYVIVGGRGQFLVDGECIDVKEGSVLRISPPAARAWRNNSDAPLYFLCLQYRADSIIQGGTLDGLRVEGEPSWSS